MAAALPTDPRSWSIEHVQMFCVAEELFADMAEILKDNEINGPALLELTTAELRDDLNVKSLGRRKAMLRRIAELEPRPGASRQQSSNTGAEARMPPGAELRDSPRVTKRVALQNSLAAPSPKSSRRGDSDSQAPVVSIGDVDQALLFEKVATMRAAPVARRSVLHVVMLAPPDNRGEITFKSGPQAGQAVPKVELAVMDSEGTVSRITLIHQDAANVSDGMQQGKSYFVTNVTKKEVPQLTGISGMEFTGWLGSMVYPATKQLDIRLPSPDNVTTWGQLSEVTQDTALHLYGVVAHVGELEQDGRLRKVVLVDPAEVENENAAAITVALWSPRAQVFDTELVGRACTMCGLKTREYQGELQLSSTMSTYWKCDVSGERTSVSSIAYAFVKAAPKFQVLESEVKPFMHWADQADGDDRSYVTNVRVSTFEVSRMEHCSICSARVEMSFVRNEPYWCHQCMKSVDDVRVSKLARLTIFPVAKSEQTQDNEYVQNGMRAVAFGSAAQALADRGESTPILNSIVRVRMSVRRVAEGVEAVIHAC